MYDHSLVSIQNIEVPLWCVSPGLLAMFCAAILILPFATTEFADGPASAAALTGLMALIRSEKTERGFFLLGLGIGAAFLFRYHYLSMIPIVLIIFPFWSGFSWRRWAISAASLITGFVVTSLPLLAVNVLVYGNPIDTGFSSYIIGHFVIKDLDWNDFLGTYALWPVKKVLSERLSDFLRHLLSTAAYLWSKKMIKVGIAMFIPALFAVWPSEKRYKLVAIMVVAMLYTAANILPTRYTVRAFVPVSALIGIIVAGGFFLIVRLFRQQFVSFPRMSWAVWLIICCIAAIFLCWQPNTIRDMDKRRTFRWVNQIIVNNLTKLGMARSRDVFCSDYNLYNLNDPKFLPFVNYGGWILLDRKYRKEMPPPTKIHTAAEWNAYFTSAEVKFVILLADDESVSMLISNPSVAGLMLLFKIGPWYIFNHIP